MDSLSSAPGNRNNNRLLSAAFAIAASVSWAVNAATTPNFTEEPAGSPKVVNAASAQKAILDMLPTDHKSRPGIAASIKALEDGGNVQELTSLFLWAKKIVENPAAPPAAKEKAQSILDILLAPEVKENEEAIPSPSQLEVDKVAATMRSRDLWIDTSLKKTDIKGGQSKKLYIVEEWQDGSLIINLENINLNARKNRGEIDSIIIGSGDGFIIDASSLIFDVPVWKENSEIEWFAFLDKKGVKKPLCSPKTFNVAKKKDGFFVLSGEGDALEIRLWDLSWRSFGGKIKIYRLREDKTITASVEK